MNSFISSFTNSFSSCVWLAILLVAICPLLEGKIAIPLALNSLLWAGKNLSPLNTFIISVFGSGLPCIFVVMLARKLKSKTTGFVHDKFMVKYLKRADKLDGYSNFKKYLLLCGFASLPLPLTGVWSSSLIAGFTNLNIFYSALSILIGNTISCGIMVLLCCYFSNSLGNICMISLLLILFFMIIDTFANIIKRKYMKG